MLPKVTKRVEEEDGVQSNGSIQTWWVEDRRGQEGGFMIEYMPRVGLIEANEGIDLTKNTGDLKTIVDPQKWAFSLLLLDRNHVHFYPMCYKNTCHIYNQGSGKRFRVFMTLHLYSYLQTTTLRYICG